MGKKGGVVGGLRQTFMGDGGAGAAQSAAEAQAAEAARQYKEQSAIVNNASIAGLARFDQALGAQEKNLARQEQLVAQIDPTIIEASQQALRLLRGDQSSTLAPMQAQRDRQRQKLLASLREQLGPGAETSTAGIQAITRFDAETNSLFAGAQQQALGNVASIFGQFSSGKPNMGGEIGLLAQLGQSRTGMAFDQAKLLNMLGQGRIQTAGASYTKDTLIGQQNAAFGGQLVKLGMAGLTGGASLLVDKYAGSDAKTEEPKQTVTNNYY